MNSSSTVFGIKKIQEGFKTLALLQLTAFMWPQQANIEDGATFDYIIVGAGSAGCVIANRLTEAKAVKVLLIEAGGDPPVESVFPGLLPFMKNSDVDWIHTTENDHYSQQFHKNYGVELTRGKMLGGSSSINFMAYTRGHSQTYDEWAWLTQDDTWSWENVLPYFIKSEQLMDPALLNSIEKYLHGTDGYLKLTKEYQEDTLKYLEAFAETGQNTPLDTNGFYPLGYSASLLTVADGERQSTANAFLRPIKDRPNLFVLKETLVSKILFDSHKNAVGVEAILKDNRTMSFKATKEVIISAGSINTPQLLMLSGIGPADHLHDMNINVVSDLPVGQTLQDHVMVLTNNVVSNSTPSEPKDPRKYPLSLLIGYSTITKDQPYPDYQTLNLLLHDASDVLNFCSFYFSYIDEICDNLYNESIGKEVLFSLVVILNPESRGKILLRSSNPKDKPVIYTGYYSDDRDLTNHAKYLEDFIKVYETNLFKGEGARLVVPKACGCDDLCDLDFWRCYALCMMVSGYHYVGSCPMGTVVDSRLNVLGVQRLRVADSSVMPQIPRANTNAAAIMIGEKASDFIKRDNFFRGN